MYQAFPYYDLLAEELRGSLAIVSEGVVILITHSGGLVSVIFTIHPYALDTNPRTTQGPMVYITITARAEWG